MLFISGSKDSLAEIDLLRSTIASLRGQATLELIVDADHAFHVPARTGRRDADVLAAALEKAVQWMTNTTNAAI